MYLFILVGGWLLWNIVVASATHLYESAIGKHVTPPSWGSSHLPPHPILSRLSQSTSFGFPASYIKLPPATYFTYGNVYVSMLFSESSPPSPLSVHKFALYVCDSRFLYLRISRRGNRKPPEGWSMVRGQCDEISHDKQFSLSHNFMKFYYQGILQIQLAYHFVELTWL